MTQPNRTVDALVEEQFHRWQQGIRRRSKSGQVETHPIITISRQHGSGGVELGRKLADRLDFSFWHKEILHEIALSQNVSERMLASFDEHRRSAISEIVGNLVLSSREHSEYVRALAKVLHAIATHGAAVIIGRGAQDILGPAGLLRVLVVAPLELRVANLMAAGKSEVEAHKEIASVDRDRADFIRQVFHRDVNDPNGYDLVLNMGSFEPGRAMEVVMTAIRGRFADKL